MRSLTKILITFILGIAMPAIGVIAQGNVSILSPKASSIIKYGDYPVSLYTGLVDITVPIYTVESGSIKVPIEFKYHSSGLRFDQKSMEAGLGWDLVAGGAIIASVKGAVDGVTNFVTKDVSLIEPCVDVTTGADYLMLREVENGRRDYLQRDNSISTKDGEIDMYQFNFLDHSGSFCLPPLGSEVEKNGVPGKSAPSGGLFIPANGMKVLNGHSNLDKTIIDADGVSYFFVRMNVTSDERLKEFYLTQIVSANKADTVTFEYKKLSILDGMRRPYITSTGTRTVTSIPSASYYTTDYFNSGGLYYQYPSPPRLEAIRFKGRIVYFQYNEQNTNRNYWDLKSIEVYDKVKSGNEKAVKTVRLSKGKFVNNEERLDEVIFSNYDGNDSYSYKFEYDGEPGSGVDYWGYANGSSMQYFVPDLVNSTYIFSTNREPNESIMKMGTLNKITYPSKGSTKFTYEAHRGRYSEAYPIKIYGGLRIKAIENYAENGQLAEKKWYTYSDGIASEYPTISNFINTSYNYEISLDPHSGQISNPLRTTTNTTYSAWSNVDMSVSGGSYVVYDNVKEYVGNATEDYGYTNYSYSVYRDERPYSQGYTFRLNTHDVHLRHNSWRSGKLRSKQVHKKIDGTNYQMIYRLDNTYKNINEAEYRNLRVFSFMNFTYNPQSSSMPDVMRDFCRHTQYHMGYNKTPFDYFNYYTTTGLQVLNSSEEYVDGAWSYTYYDAYTESGQPSKVRRTTSSGDSISTTYKYPSDLTGAVYTNMKAQNILTPVVEAASYKNGTDFLQKNTTNYKLWHSTFYAPENQQIQYKDGTSRNQTTYSYNKGANPQEIVSNESQRKVYLWGYGGQYPIAEIQNSTYIDVLTKLGGQTVIDQLNSISVTEDFIVQKMNALRAALPNAQITSYMYKPLVGMTSKTDARGIIEHYQYDGFRRLQQVLDQTRQLRQSYDYHYKP